MKWICTAWFPAHLLKLIGKVVVVSHWQIFVSACKYKVDFFLKHHNTCTFTICKIFVWKYMIFCFTGSFCLSFGFQSAFPPGKLPYGLAICSLRLLFLNINKNVMLLWWIFLSCFCFNKKYFSLCTLKRNAYPCAVQIFMQFYYFSYIWLQKGQM